MHGVARYRSEHDVKLLSWSSVFESPSAAKFSASGIHVPFFPAQHGVRRLHLQECVRQVVLSRGTCAFQEVCEWMTKGLAALAPLAMEIMVSAPRRELHHCRRQTLRVRGTRDVYIRENLYVIVVLSSGTFARLSPGPNNFNADGFGYLYARSVLDRTGLDLPYSETCVAHLRPGDEEITG